LNTRQYSRNSITLLLLQDRLNDFGIDSIARSQVGGTIPGSSSVAFVGFRASSLEPPVHQLSRGPAVELRDRAQAGTRLPRALAHLESASGIGVAVLVLHTPAASRPAQRR